jgi:hypothetical protein
VSQVRRLVESRPYRVTFVAVEGGRSHAKPKELAMKLDIDWLPESRELEHPDLSDT